MCTVNVSVNESLLREYDPALSSDAAISNWIQELIESKLNEMKAVHVQEFVEVDIDNL